MINHRQSAGHHRRALPSWQRPTVAQEGSVGSALWVSRNGSLCAGVARPEVARFSSPLAPGGVEKYHVEVSPRCGKSSALAENVAVQIEQAFFHKKLQAQNRA